jgi:hypothetical protein
VQACENKIGGEQPPPIPEDDRSEVLKFYFLTVLLGAGVVAFLATFLAGAFLAGAFLGAGFLAAGLPAAFLAGISYPPFHSAVAEDKKSMSFQFA